MSRPGRRALGAALLAAAALPSALRAETLSLSLATGLSRPRQAAVRQVYSSRLPISFALRLRVAEGVGLLAGVESWPSRGAAVSASGGGEGGYDLSLALDTLPLGGWVRIPVGPVRIGMSGGAVHFRFEEIWASLDLRVHDRRWGWFLSLDADVPFAGRLAFSASLRYDVLPTGAGSPLVERVDLGGWRALAGLSVALF